MNITPDINKLGGAQSAQQAAAVKSADGFNEDRPFFVNAGEETTEVFSTRPDDAFSHKLTQVFRRENHDLIHGLSELSGSEKTELALNAYYQMQGRVQQAVKREETDIGIFTALEAQKSEILSMRETINESGSVTDDVGEVIDAPEIEKRLENVQSMIDKLIRPFDDEDTSTAAQRINVSAKQDFAAYAEIFKETTGLTGDALGVSDDLLIHKTDRTEENFAQKAQETINSLKTQSGGLRELKNTFMGQLSTNDKENTERMSEEAMTNLAVFEFFRERFTYAGLYDNSDNISKFRAMA